MTTYGEIKRAVLELINQYSVAGETISPAYNNQSDDIRRIPNLINQALMDIRTGVRPERAAVRLEPGRDAGGGWQLHPLPAGFWRLRTGGLWRLGPDGPVPADCYMLQGRGGILTPPGEYLAEYDRYPEQLPADPPDHYELDEPPETVQAACYYAAAWLVMREDEFAYASLRNEYESRLSRLLPDTAAEARPVLDAYRFFDAGVE